MSLPETVMVPGGVLHEGAARTHGDAAGNLLHGRDEHTLTSAQVLVVCTNVGRQILNGYYFRRESFQPFQFFRKVWLAKEILQIPSVKQVFFPLVRHYHF